MSTGGAMPIIHSDSVRGMRSTQEDRFHHTKILLKNGTIGSLLAVFDGHGGDKASAACLEIMGGPRTAGFVHHLDGEGAVREIFKELHKKTAHMNDGTCAALTLIHGDSITIGIIGDCSVIIQSDKELHISPQHNARTNIDERHAAERRGGEYIEKALRSPDGGCWIQLARALGDANFGNVILREPEIYSLALLPKSVVLVCSDGLLDRSRENKIEQRAAELMKRISSQDEFSFARIIENASMISGDNTTAIVWKDE
jgi:serine/threonine protein phosphatase PrpC